MKTIAGQKIWIVGASSGIGAALAAELDGAGAELTLSARRRDELESVAAGLKLKAAIAPLDVRDAEAVRKTALDHGPFDSVIVLAAVYKPGLIEAVDTADASATIDVNIRGSLNIVDAVYPAMRAARAGQIVLCGSVAGFCGLPYSQPYSLTKAAIISYAQTLRVEAAEYGIDVKLINPGFVRTPLTAKNDFDMPMMIEPATAAREIRLGLLARGFEIHFPKGFTRVVKLLSILPYPLYFALARGILKKKTDRAQGR